MDTVSDTEKRGNFILTSRVIRLERQLAFAKDALKQIENTYPETGDDAKEMHGYATTALSKIRAIG